MRDQAAGLRRKLLASQNPRNAKTIAVVSGKGGVGKSNFAINFSLELINNGKKVLLFDLDVGMGNIDILLGLQAEKSIVDMFNDRLSIYDIIETGPNNLSYIAAGSALAHFFSMDQTNTEYFFSQYNELIELYDYIIFDMGAGATIDSLQFVLAADECIVITTPEPTAITDAYGMVKHIINKKQNMPIYVVMNRTQSINSGMKALERFQRVIFQFLEAETQAMGVLPDDKHVKNAVIQQTPYILLNDKAAISKAMKVLVSSYLAKSFDLLKSKEPFSFVKKLKQLVMER